MENGYSICFNKWALDKDIKNELNLLLIISSLCAEKGYCWATNEYLGKLFDISEETISRKLKILENKNYIIIEYKKRGCEVIERKIRLTKISIDDYQKYQSTIDENVKENNISVINNININNKENIIKESSNDLENEFEILWKMYPKKQGKTSALKSYIRARKKGVGVEIITIGLQKYLDYIKIKGTDIQYIKNGSTWFNQECWNDEYDISQTKRKSDRQSEILRGVYNGTIKID